jgi:ligand-binding sensor domain-containing protein
MICPALSVRNLLQSLLCLCLFSGMLPHLSAADSRSAHLIVPQASVDPRPIRLPVIDGADIQFAPLSTAEGLSQTRVAQIVEDDQGFVWFGTQYGLNRYDGYEFKVFVHDPRNPKSLSGVSISALFKDRNGTLWVGCDQFLNRFDSATEAFARYQVPYATHISQDTSGTLWLATGTGLYSLDPATGRIRQYSHDPNAPLSLSSSDVKSSGEDKEGQFWGVNSEGLDEFDRSTGKVTLHVPFREPLRESSFYEDRFGVFWIYHVSGNGLAVFDRKTNTLTPYSFYEQDQPSSAVTGVMAMLEDQNGTLWLGTQGDGLLKFDRGRRRFIRYRNDPDNHESLAQNSVISLLADTEGNFWAGLGGAGPTRFSAKPPPFKRLLPDLRNRGHVGENFVESVYEDHQGILWMGTREALVCINRKSGRYIPFHPPWPGGGADVITIREDRSENLWAGTFNHGLLRFDR